MSVKKDKLLDFLESSVITEFNLDETTPNIEPYNETKVLKYVHECEKFIGLQTDIKSCDKILEEMEMLMSDYQSDLGKLSTDIQALQEQSFDLSRRLKNRVSVRKELGKVIDGLSLSPDMIKVICEGDVDEEFVELVIKLGRKLSFIRRNGEKNISAIEDVIPEMEKLRLKTAERIRSFMLEKIKSLTSGMNISVIQHSVLLKNKSLFYFVRINHPEVSGEISAHYIHVMNNYFHGRFTKYISRLLKLQLISADENDVIGVEDVVKKGLASFYPNKAPPKVKYNFYSLGERIDILKNLEAPALLCHVAEEKHIKLWIESIFRTITRVLIDNASSEYCFVSEFFESKKSSKTHTDNIDYFTEIFGKTIKYAMESLEQLVESSYDALGILLCIRINTQHRLIMQNRKLTCLDNFLNRVNLLLWPRFQLIMDLHLSSVSKGLAPLSAGGSGNAVNILEKGVNLLEKGGILSHNVQASQDVVMRRYTELESSILKLNQDYDDQNLLSSLSRLKNGVDVYCNK
jgi:hypothetical protein